jgi:steroid delta-isomerase-like uncharacterized protein
VNTKKLLGGYTMSEANKAVSERFYTEVWGQGNLAVVDDLVAENFIDHSLPPELPKTREGFKMFAGMFLNAFPGMKITVEDTISEGDRVVTRWSAAGKHEGELMGIPATGKDVIVTGISIERFADGKIVEAWGEFDMAGMLMQLGVAPPMGG